MLDLWLHLQRGMKEADRRLNYRCDITYTNNSVSQYLYMYTVYFSFSCKAAYHNTYKFINFSPRGLEGQNILKKLLIYFCLFLLYWIFLFWIFCPFNFPGTWFWLSTWQSGHQQGPTCHEMVKVIVFLTYYCSSCAIITLQTMLQKQAKTLPFCNSWWSWFCPHWWGKKSFIDQWSGNLEIYELIKGWFPIIFPYKNT